MDSEIIKKHWEIIAEVLKELKLKHKYISSDGDTRVRSAFLDLAY